MSEEDHTDMDIEEDKKLKESQAATQEKDFTEVKIKEKNNKKLEPSTMVTRARSKKQ